MADEQKKEWVDKTRLMVDRNAPVDGLNAPEDLAALDLVDPTPVNRIKRRINDAQQFAAEDETAQVAALQADIAKTMGECQPKVTSEVNGATLTPQPPSGRSGPASPVRQFGRPPVRPDGRPPELPPGEQMLKDCGYNWVKAKETYGDNKAKMQLLADFRKKRVDEWLKTKLGPLGVHKGEGWNSVGSDEPTSDYDITIYMHGKREGQEVKDFEMVRMFNEDFRKEFRAEAGTVFDTNLYANAPKLPRTNEDQDAAKTHDVAALMKIRRYMSSREFDDFRERTVKEFTGEEQEAQNLQFETADANYAVVQADIVKQAQALIAKVVVRSAALDELAREIEAALNPDASGQKLFEAQAQLEDLAKRIERELKDETLSVTNEIYAGAIGDERRQEGAYHSLKDVKNKLDADGLKPAEQQKILESCRAELTKHNEKGIGVTFGSKAIDDALAALEAGGALPADTLKRIQEETAKVLSNINSSDTIAMYFANEAYQSSGPFKHVVDSVQTTRAAAEKQITATHAARQGSELDAAIQVRWDELRKEAETNLTPDECLQSFNEQLGDFLKDLDHYGKAEPGKAFIQSSKYLDRLIDAGRLLLEKKMLEGDGSTKEAVRAQVALQPDIRKTLIAARKGNFELMNLGRDSSDVVDQVAQSRAHACAFAKEKLRADSVAQLASHYKELAVAVNVAVRKKMAQPGQGGAAVVENADDAAIGEAAGGVGVRV